MKESPGNRSAPVPSRGDPAAPAVTRLWRVPVVGVLDELEEETGPCAPVLEDPFARTVFGLVGGHRVHRARISVALTPASVNATTLRRVPLCVSCRGDRGHVPDIGSYEWPREPQREAAQAEPTCARIYRLSQSEPSPTANEDVLSALLASFGGAGGGGRERDTKG